MRRREILDGEDYGRGSFLYMVAGGGATTMAQVPVGPKYRDCQPATLGFKKRPRARNSVLQKNQLLQTWFFIETKFSSLGFYEIEFGILGFFKKQLSQPSTCCHSELGDRW